jgi:hypothetical protein
VRVVELSYNTRESIKPVEIYISGSIEKARLNMSLTLSELRNYISFTFLRMKSIPNRKFQMVPTWYPGTVMQYVFS